MSFQRQPHHADVPDEDYCWNPGAGGTAGVQADHSPRGGRGWERHAQPGEAGPGRQQGRGQLVQSRKGHRQLITSKTQSEHNQVSSDRVFTLERRGAELKPQ